MTYSEMEKWAKWWTRRYSWALKSRADLDAEDLTQAALVGICTALETYKEDGNWATWSSYFIRKEIRALLGIRAGRQYPVVYSLNAPVNDESDESMIDLLPDEDAPDAQEVAEYNDIQKQVRAAVARLADDRQRKVVERTQLQGENAKAVAQDFGVSTARVHSIWIAAKKNLAHDPALRALADIELRTNYIARSSWRSFQTTHTSDVEHVVIWRERERARLAEKIQKCDDLDRKIIAATTA